MSKATWLSEYTHVDGTRWSGPHYHAETQEEAQALAMDYPIQPMRIIGELVDEVETGDDGRDVLFRAPRRMH